MTEHGWEKDDWPRIQEKVMAGHILYSLQHMGCVIPPQADAGWMGEAGPDRSYLDERSGGPEAIRGIVARAQTPCSAWAGLGQAFISPRRYRSCAR